MHVTWQLVGSAAGGVGVGWLLVLAVAIRRLQRELAQLERDLARLDR